MFNILPYLGLSKHLENLVIYFFFESISQILKIKAIVQ